MSKGAPTPVSSSPQGLPAPHLPYLSTLPTPHISNHPICQREKELEGGLGDALRRGRGAGAEREGLLTGLGWEQPENICFHLAQPQWPRVGVVGPRSLSSLPSPGLAPALEPGGGQKDPGMASGVLGGTSTTSLFSRRHPLSTLLWPPPPRESGPSVSPKFCLS